MEDQNFLRRLATWISVRVFTKLLLLAYLFLILFWMGGLLWIGIFGNPQTGPHNKCCRMCVPLPMRKNWGDFGEVCQGSGINNEGQQGCYSDCFFFCLFVFFSRPLPGKGFLKLNSFLWAMKCLCWHAWFLEMLNLFFHFIHRLI